jgi:hypothetical protein
MMTPRKVLLALSVSLLVGCGRNDQPTVRHTSSDAGRSKSAEKSSETASKSSAPAQKKRDDQGGSTAPAKLTDLKAADTKRDDAKTPAGEGEKPAATPAEIPAADAKLAPSTDAAANAVKPPTTAGPGNGASQSAVTSPAAQDITALVPSGKPMTADAAGKQTALESQREVKIGGMRLVAPESWNRKRPRLKILLAEFGVPAMKQGLPEAQLTVTQSIKDDPKAIDQLREEIKDEEQSKDAAVTRLRIADHDVILVDSTEADEDAANSASPGGSRYRSLNAMIFIGGSVFFVTYSGPEAAVTERVGEFREFLQTLKSIDQPH